MSHFKYLVLAFTLLLQLGPVARADQNVVVVLDDSGSMRDRMRTENGRVARMEAAKKALIGVLNNLPENTNVGVLALNTRVNDSPWIVPLGNADRRQWAANIADIEADGGTPLGEFMRTAADELLVTRGEQIYGTYRLLIVTDGEANDPELINSYLPQILSRGLIVDVIGVDMTAEHSLAARAHSYRSADDDASLEQAISEVFAETSNDDQNAQDDFELIAGLPDGFAEVALASLSRTSHEPLAEAGTPEAEELRINYNAGNPLPANSGESFANFALGSLVCCFGTFIAIAVLIGSLIAKNNANRRGRGR